MKTRYIQLFVAAALLAACEKSEESISDTPIQPLSIEISVSDAVSRTIDMQYGTSFAAGDLIGFFALDANGKILINNQPIKFNGLRWTGTIAYKENMAQFFSYYPYRSNMNGMSSEQALIDAFEPLTDQSMETAYRDSDLLTGAGTIDPAKNVIRFNFSHRMTMLELQLPLRKWQLASDAGFVFTSPVEGTPLNELTIDETPVTPYYPAGSRIARVLLKPSAKATTVTGVFPDGQTEKIVQKVIPAEQLAEGMFKRINIQYVCKETQIYDLQPGDFLMKDGSIWPRYATTNCIPEGQLVGLIFQTDATRIGEAESKALGTGSVPHGLVISLPQTNRSYAWSMNYDADEGLNKLSTPQANYNSLSGLANCNTIWTNHPDEFSPTSNETTSKYPLFWKAYTYDQVVERPDPQIRKTTPWFVPSSGQLWDFGRNIMGATALDGLKTSVDMASSSSFISTFSDYGAGAVDQFNERIKATSKTFMTVNMLTSDEAQPRSGTGQCCYWSYRPSTGKVTCESRPKGQNDPAWFVLAF